MARIGASLGGTVQGNNPQPGKEWRQPPNFTPRGNIDWEKQHTPEPSRSQRLGKGRQTLADVPVLPERTINVRAKGLGTFYTADGMPIPADQWVSLPISPGLIQAVKDGNLERGPDTPPVEPRRRSSTSPAA